MSSSALTTVEHGNSKGRASLLCLDRRTGAIRSSLQLPQAGDVRCNIAYDAQSGNYYFSTTKGGYFYSIQVHVRRVSLTRVLCAA